MGDARTGFLVVTAPERPSLAEAGVFVERLGAGGMHLAGLVVNRWNRFAELSARGVERAVGCPVLAVVRDRPRGMHGYRNGRAELDRWPAGTPFAALRPVVHRLGRAA